VIRKREKELVNLTHFSVGLPARSTPMW